MNEADSEKVNMLLMQSGFLKVASWQEADLVIFNTCSVRKKGEDRVYSIMNDILKSMKSSGKHTVTGITGCMVRKTGMSKKYLDENVQRDRVKKIELIKNTEGIFNYDDKLFPKIEILDFTMRIEEIKYLPHILTHIYGEKIGQEDKFDDYLKSKQQRENPYSASVIIQTGCDNYCSFCIVPYTRGKEISRPIAEITKECEEAVKNGSKEITLLGQNVNSYGKQFVDKKLWNEEKGKWNSQTGFKIGIDIDGTLIHSVVQEVLDTYNEKYGKNTKMEDITTYDFNGNKELEAVFFEHFWNNCHTPVYQENAEGILEYLKLKGHKLYIVTSREAKIKDITLTFLEKTFGADFFEQIIFVKEHVGADKKHPIGNEFNLDFMIEDADHHIKDFQELTATKVIIFSNPWNISLETDNKKTFRANHWNDIKSIINQESQSPFRQLLESVNSVKGIERIRFTSSNPHDMTQDILSAHFELPYMCNYLHFALQSGSNELLKRMNRKHTYEDFKEKVQYLRKKDPLFSISTDIIVGFSGETEEMFEATLKAFDECVFDFSYNARYSIRP